MRFFRSFGLLHRAVLAALVGMLFLVACSITGCDSQKSGQARSNTISIQIVHGPETRALLSSLRDQFNQVGQTLADGSNVQVELISDMGLSAALRLAKGDLKSDGWLAPSTTVVRFSNGSRINLGPEQGECAQLFYSPVVAAVRTDQVESLGAAGGAFSWSSLLPSLMEQSSELGSAISFAHTQPRSAVTGFAGLIQLAYLSARKSELSVSDFKDGKAAEDLEQVQSHVFAYPLSESFLLAKSARSSPANIRFAFTTEQQVYLYNQNRPPESPELVGLFTREGTYREDYQLCTSLADWVTPARRAAFQLFSRFVQSSAAKELARSAGFRIAEDHIAVNASESAGTLAESTSASAAPSPESALLPDPFPPLSYEVAAHLFEQWERYRRPAALMLVVDRSGSMEGDALFLVKEQLRSLLALTSPKDKKALMVFGSDVKVLSEFTEDSSQLIPAIDTLQAVGGSALYSAIGQAIEKLSSNDLSRYRRSVIIVTDGEDKNSDISLMTLVKMVERLVPAHGIELSIIGIRREGADFSDLERVAQTADGNFRSASLMELSTVFQDLAKGL